MGTTSNIQHPTSKWRKSEVVGPCCVLRVALGAVCCELGSAPHAATTLPPPGSRVGRASAHHAAGRDGGLEPSTRLACSVAEFVRIRANGSSWTFQPEVSRLRLRVSRALSNAYHAKRVRSPPYTLSRVEGEECRISNTECRMSKVADPLLPHARRSLMSASELFTSTFGVRHSPFPGAADLLHCATRATPAGRHGPALGGRNM